MNDTQNTTESEPGTSSTEATEVTSDLGRRTEVQPPVRAHHVELLALAFVLGIAAGLAGLYMYKASAPDANKTVVQTDTVPDKQITKSADTKETTSEPIASDTRLSYTDPVSDYSFKYPKSWSLHRETEKNPYNHADATEYEKITLTNADNAVVTLDYPFEMLGCGPTTETLPYDFGSYSAKMIDLCGGVPEQAGEEFMIMFNNPRPIPSGMTAKEWPNLRLRYTPGAGSWDDFKAFAKSLSGLVPLDSYLSR